MKEGDTEGERDREWEGDAHLSSYTIMQQDEPNNTAHTTCTGLHPTHRREGLKQGNLDLLSPPVKECSDCTVQTPSQTLRSLETLRSLWEIGHGRSLFLAPVATGTHYAQLVA